MRYRVSKAVQALGETEAPFDLILNDIDKKGYPDSLPVISEKLRPGGVLIIDNMLWHGKIVDESDQSEDRIRSRRARRSCSPSARGGDRL